MLKEFKKEQSVWLLLRLSMGWIFFWAFLDKLIGLGFSTSFDKSWILGNSPTFGFLTHGAKGPFAELYSSLAGSLIVDWLFMLGLLFVGLTLLIGIYVKQGSTVGILMLILIYSAGFLPPVNNPFLDEHIVYIIIMIGLIYKTSSLKLTDKTIDISGDIPK